MQIDGGMGAQVGRRPTKSWTRVHHSGRLVHDGLERVARAHVQERCFVRVTPSAPVKTLQIVAEDA